MKTCVQKIRIFAALIALAGLAVLAPGDALALDVTLTATTYTKALPGGETVPMWGYGVNGGPVNPAAVPVITMPSADSTLNITLQNNLPGSNATSVMIPGLRATGMAPVRTGDGRIYSFDKVTAVGASQVYAFTDVPAGVYLIHSGTYPNYQVPMGLTAVVVKPAAPGQAYNGATAYDDALVVVYGEVDPTLHNAVANGTYGTAAEMTTVHFRPKYHLVNGLPFSSDRLPARTTATGGQTLLVRLVNAGIQSHSPQFPTHVSLVAENSRLKYAAEEVLGVNLPPQSTADVLLTVPAAAGKFAILDRELKMSNGNIAGPGGAIHIIEHGQTSVTCTGDFNQNGVLDRSDWVHFIRSSEFGRLDCSPAAPCLNDLNLDGKVNLTDLFLFRSLPATCPAAPAAVAVKAVPDAPQSPATAIVNEIVSGCPASGCTGDVNRSGAVDSSDLTALVASLDASAPIRTPAGVLRRGDVNGDGLITSLDMDLVLLDLGTACAAGAPCPADLDGDRAVTKADVVLEAALVQASAAAPAKLAAVTQVSADLNGDGMVSREDMIILMNNMGKSGCGKTANCLGDLNTDGSVNEADLSTMRERIGDKAGRI